MLLALVAPFLGPAPAELAVVRNGDIRAVRADGTAPRNLTRSSAGEYSMRPDGGGQRPLAGLPRRDDWKPRFSTDGKRIACETRITGSDVYVVGADGRGLRLPVRNASEPAWRPR